MQTTSPLYLRTLLEQQRRNAAALAAIESRATDISELEKLVAALRARGWKAEANIDTVGYGNHAACAMNVLLSCSEPELLDAIDFLTADGVAVARQVTGDMGCSRQYGLRLSRFAARLVAYVHSPAREAA